MAEEASVHMERARSALADAEILLGHSGSHQGAIGRASVAMVHAGWAMLLSLGETVGTYEGVIPALEGRFTNNSRFYGFITGARDVYLRAEFGPPVVEESLKFNAEHAVSNASEFIGMARRFISTGDGRVWSAL